MNSNQKINIPKFARKILLKLLFLLKNHKNMQRRDYNNIRDHKRKYVKGKLFWKIIVFSRQIKFLYAYHVDYILFSMKFYSKLLISRT